MDSMLPLSSNQWIKREEIRLAEPNFIIGIDILVAPEEQEILRQIAPAFLCLGRRMIGECIFG